VEIESWAFPERTKPMVRRIVAKRNGRDRMLLEISRVYAAMKCMVERKWRVKKNRF
jgi:hypothetical protein